MCHLCTVNGSISSANAGTANFFSEAWDPDATEGVSTVSGTLVSSVRWVGSGGELSLLPVGLLLATMPLGTADTDEFWNGLGWYGPSSRFLRL
jgi:hypothetical protein